MKFLTPHEEIIVKLEYPEFHRRATELNKYLRDNPFPHGILKIDFEALERGYPTRAHMAYETAIGHVGYFRCRQQHDGEVFLYIWPNDTTEYGWRFDTYEECEEWFNTDYPFITERIAHLCWTRKRS